MVFVITSHGPNVDEDSELIAQRNTINISMLKFPPIKSRFYLYLRTKRSNLLMYALDKKSSLPCDLIQLRQILVKLL